MAGEHPLRRYRKRNRLTLDALGRMLGVTGMTIWRWEKGKRAPRRRDIPKIAEVTGIAPAKLMGLEAK